MLANQRVVALTRIAVALAAMSLLAACGRDSPSAPTAADALDQRPSSQFVDFRHASGDSVDGRRQDAYHEWALRTLGVEPQRRLQYSKYRDAGHMRRVTGQATNGFAEPPTFTVHSIWPWDAHEAVHVYTALVGRPSDFFNEGIAVALTFDPADGRFVSLWNNTPIHDIARTLGRTGALPRIETMTETEAFRRQPDQQSYPVAGSFVSFLIDDRGMSPVLAFFRAGTRGDSRATIETRFAGAFGYSVAEAETRWLAFLAKS